MIRFIAAVFLNLSPLLTNYKNYKRKDKDIKSKFTS